MPTPTITRIYVRRYRDSGQVTAFVEWSIGGYTKGNAEYSNHHRAPTTPSFGAHIHALFARAHREGLRLERETW